MTPKFNLQTRRTDKDNPINLILIISGNRLKWSTGHKISLKNWDDKAQFPKRNPANRELISKLDLYRSIVETITGKLEAMGEAVTVQKVKDHLDSETGRTSTVKAATDQTALLEHYADFMEYATTNNNESSMQRFDALKNHLTQYQVVYKCKLTFDAIDMNFYDKMIMFLGKPYTYNNNGVELTRPGLQTNTVSKYIKAIKTFMKWAYDRKRHANLEFKNFRAKEVDQQIIFLTPAEVTQLYVTKYSSDRIKRAADIAVFACLTSLRDSDLRQVKPEYISNGVLRLRTKKTDEYTEIPLLPQALEILERYDYQLPIISNQKLNTYIKEAAREAGINSPVQLTENRLGQKERKTYQKWQVLSIHDMRKTFVTIAMQRGIPVEVIMSITTHRQHKVFRRYLEITRQHKETEMQKLGTVFNQPVPKYKKQVRLV